MELKSLNTETQELIINSLGVYNALRSQSKLYRLDGVSSLSLYVGVLRLGSSVTLKRRELLSTGYGTGYPYPDGIRPSAKSERSRYRLVSHNYENVVCQILNQYGVTIEQVVDLLNLDRRLMMPSESLVSEKIERQYQGAYKELLQTIRDYYVASVKQESMNSEYCNPVIDISIPTIISAIHYSNIDASNSISSLYAKVKGIDNSSTIVPDYLEEIEKYVTYSENMVKRNSNGQLQLYQVKKPLVMNKSIGKII